MRGDSIQSSPLNSNCVDLHSFVPPRLGCRQCSLLEPKTRLSLVDQVSQ